MIQCWVTETAFQLYTEVCIINTISLLYCIDTERGWLGQTKDYKYASLKGHKLLVEDKNNGSWSFWVCYGLWVRRHPLSPSPSLFLYLFVCRKQLLLTENARIKSL